MPSSVYLQILLTFLAPVIAQLDMKFTKYPESVTAPPGDKVTFECEVNVPGESFVWRWKPDRDSESWSEVVEGDGLRIVNSVPGRITKLEVNVKTDMEVALYQCVIWYGAVSLISLPARLTIARLIPPQKVLEKRVVIAPIQNTVVLHCPEPQSEPPAVLTWWKEGGSKGKRKQLETPYGVLVIHNATSGDSGTYSCRATNELSGETVDVPQSLHLKLQHEAQGDVRFLESEEYVGVKDSEGVLTMPVKPNGTLRLWCGVVGTPPPKISWSLEGKSTSLMQENEQMLMISPFTPAHEGVYSCSANGIRRSWKVVALQPPHWEGIATNLNANEGGEAHVTCGNAFGQPAPSVYWVVNAEVIKSGKGIKANDTELYISRVQKKHAGIVQCVACSALGCAYDAAMLTVMPLQIQDQDYPVELPKVRNPQQPPKRHNRKNPRKHKAVMIPPSRPNVTRLSDESVMVSWSNDSQGLPIQFFKVQYKEVSNSSNVQWNTANQDIPAHIHSYEIDGLTPGKYYKFRIAAVYSNQDNKMGRSSGRFHLQRGEFRAPLAPTLTKTTPVSPNSIQLDWTWSSGGSVEAEGFYVYYRTVSSAGPYEKVPAAGGAGAHSLRLAHLAADTSYEFKLQAYTAQAASEFSAIKVAKTLRPAAGAGSTSAPPAGGAPARAAPGAMVTAGGALGAAALIILCAAAFLICRRARRPTTDKEKGSAPESGGANGYIPAKVPITITANPMHSESGDGAEMSFLHNNNTGNNDDTLTHSRKNGPTARQYV